MMLNEVACLVTWGSFCFTLMFTRYALITYLPVFFTIFAILWRQLSTRMFPLRKKFDNSLSYFPCYLTFCHLDFHLIHHKMNHFHTLLIINKFQPILTLACNKPLERSWMPLFFQSFRLMCITGRQRDNSCMIGHDTNFPIYVMAKSSCTAIHWNFVMPSCILYVIGLLLKAFIKARFHVLHVLPLCTCSTDTSSQWAKTAFNVQQKQFDAMEVSLFISNVVGYLC